MKLQTVEAYFLEPLKAYFEKDPKDGAESFIIEKLEGTEVRVLEAAVEWIKANRQAQTSFPSPKECFAAVASVAEKVSRPSGPVSYSSGATYGEKLNAWMERKNAKSYPVIKKGTPEWIEWEIYFLATENKVQYPVMQGKDRWTVPTVMPSMFDDKYDWNKGDKLLRERTAFEHLSDTPARKRFVQEQLSRVRFG